MARVDTYRRCDVCGKQKQEVNHWWVIVQTPGDLFPTLYPWPTSCMTFGAKHLCGQQCVIAAIAEYMTNHTSKPEAVQN